MRKIGAASYVATVTGSQTEIGKHRTRIESIVFYDYSGNPIDDLDVHSQLEISYGMGILHIYYSELFFESDTITQYYDGSTIMNDDDDCRLVAGEFEYGDHHVVIRANNSTLTEAGSVKSKFTITVYDGNGVIVTDRYKINTDNVGRLVIKPIELTITAGSAEHKYDPSNPNYVLQCKEIFYDESVLLPGHYISSYSLKGSVSRPLEQCENVVSGIVIFDENGNDVTKNYALNCIPGKLIITLS